MRGGTIIFISRASRAQTSSIFAKIRIAHWESYCVRCRPTMTDPQPLLYLFFRTAHFVTQSSALIPLKEQSGVRGCYSNSAENFEVWVTRKKYQREVPIAMQKSLFRCHSFIHENRSPRREPDIGTTGFEGSYQAPWTEKENRRGGQMTFQRRMEQNCSVFQKKVAVRSRVCRIIDSKCAEKPRQQHVQKWSNVPIWQFGADLVKLERA